MRALAILVFLLCGVYAIGSGVQHVKGWEQPLGELETRQSEQRQEALAWFQAGQTGPEDRTYIDVTNPRWADRYAAAYWVMQPEPLAALAIGLSDIRGSWASISATTGSRPFETSDPGTLGNAEKLLAGNFDLVFVLAYLTPLLLLILLFDVGGLERDLGMMRLVRTQVSSSRRWMSGRVALPVASVMGLVAVLCLIGGVWSGALTDSFGSWLAFTGLAIGYAVLWGVLFSIVLAAGVGTSTAALCMVGLWLGLCILVPAAVRQVVSQDHPTLYASDLTTTLRSERYEILLSGLENYEADFYAGRPELSPPTEGTHSSDMARFIRQSAFLTLVEGVTGRIMRDEDLREDAVGRFGWINPAYVFQRSLCTLAGTESVNYRELRSDVLAAVNARLDALIDPLWSGESIDQPRFERLFENGASESYGEPYEGKANLYLFGLLGAGLVLILAVAKVRRGREGELG